MFNPRPYQSAATDAAKDFCVYAHKKASNGNIFYIGKGKGKRPSSKIGRSERWHRTVAKHGLIIHVIRDGMSEACAFSYEKALIFAIGRDNLINMTDGGEGTSGRAASEAQRKKCSASNKGTKPSPHSIALAKEKNSKEVATKCGLKFPSITEAAKFAHPENWRTAKVSISASARGKFSHSYGYEWGLVVDGKPQFLYVSRMNEPRPKRWKPVRASNGMEFQAVGHAVDWLKSIGWPKANTGAVCRAARYGRPIYGFGWEYV